MFYGGESNVPGAPGNLFAGGIPLRQLFPGAPSDIPFFPKEPGLLRPETKQKLKDIFPAVPGGYGGEDGGIRYGTTPGGVVNNPFGSSNFPGAVGNMGGLANAQFFEGPQLGQLVAQGRYPRGMEGAVDLTYPPGHPMYGKPILLPGLQTPLDANKAEYEGLKRMRSAPIDPRVTPQGFQNKMVY
jgi:hypothetical protein